jgi:D-sedoheptulose 7-phosphate isomerase
LGTDGILIASSSNDADPFRKPNPGMLIKAAKDMGIHLSSSYMIGDSWKDVEAGKRAGCHTIFLKTDYNQESLEKSKPDVIISSLEAIYPVIFYGTYDTHYFNISRWVIQYSIREQGGIYDNIIKKLAAIGDGRVFIMGCGGGAGNSSHAASDIRKICGIEAYSLTDNVSELTAWINDESWEDAYFDLLCTSNLSEKDVVVVFSVGGGSKKYNLSTNIIKALDYAKECGAYICGIVGRDGGYTKEVANDCVVLEVPEENVITPIVESLQMLIWHMIVTHPTLRQNEPEWEVREKWSFK